MIINTKTGKLMTTKEINEKGKPFTIDDFDRTNQVKKITNAQWKQRYSFKNNNGILVTKSKHNNKQ